MYLFIQIYNMEMLESSASASSVSTSSSSLGPSETTRDLSPNYPLSLIHSHSPSQTPSFLICIHIHYTYTLYPHTKSHSPLFPSPLATPYISLPFTLNRTFGRSFSAHQTHPHSPRNPTLESLTKLLLLLLQLQLQLLLMMLRCYTPTYTHTHTHRKTWRRVSMIGESFPYNPRVSSLGGLFDSYGWAPLRQWVISRTMWISYYSTIY